VRVADDLVERQFRPGAPNALWIADVSYLRTWEGWLYLAAVQDAYSRRIVGWSMADHMRADLVVDALQLTVARRRPAPGLIHHSDQGSQYVSLAFGQAARDAGIARSIGSKGDCYDNAVAESFFATLKKELVHRRSWPTLRELTSEVFEYIEAFYNRPRRQSTLGYLSPANYENTALIDGGTSLAASRLASPDQEIKYKRPKAQPCPSKRGKSRSASPAPARPSTSSPSPHRCRRMRSSSPPMHPSPSSHHTDTPPSPKTQTPSGISSPHQREFGLAQRACVACV
jgi:hypothetical protein